jgi:hypothetical protein
VTAAAAGHGAAVVIIPPAVAMIAAQLATQFRLVMDVLSELAGIPANRIGAALNHAGTWDGSLKQTRRTLPSSGYLAQDCHYDQ